MPIRPIDATRLVKLVLEERDKIPLTMVERYSFGYPSPYKHGQSMRGGIRKVLRLIEQAPTLDLAPVVHGEWVDGLCTVCGAEAPYNDIDEAIFDYDWEENLRYSHTETRREYHETPFCPNCGAKMTGGKKDD